MYYSGFVLDAFSCFIIGNRKKVACAAFYLVFILFCVFIYVLFGYKSTDSCSCFTA